MYFCSARWGLSLVHHYRVHRIGRPHAAFRGKYLAQRRALLPVSTILSTAGGPSGAACSPVSSTERRMDILGATPRRPGCRRRQARIMDMPAQTAPRLTEQDPCMAARAVVFDCRPALLPVSLDVSVSICRQSGLRYRLQRLMLSVPHMSSHSRGGFA